MKIRGYDYSVEYVSHNSPELFVDGEQRFAVCSYLKQIIFVRDDLRSEMKRRVLAHEITHAVIEAYGHYAHRDNFDAEDICEFMAVYGQEVMRLTEEAMR